MHASPPQPGAAPIPQAGGSTSVTVSVPDHTTQEILDAGNQTSVVHYTIFAPDQSASYQILNESVAVSPTACVA